MNIHRERKSITVSSGYGTENTLPFCGAELRQLIVEPPTSTNIYDLYILDSYNTKIYEHLACEGYYEEHPIQIPLRGVYTVSLSNATVDEVIPVTFATKE